MTSIQIRKTWLFLLCFNLVFHSVSFLLLNPNLGVPVHLPNNATRLIGVLRLANLNSFHPGWIKTVILYFCAYKKPGTRLLTCSIVSSALAVMSLLFFYPVSFLIIYDSIQIFQKTQSFATPLFTGIILRFFLIQGFLLALSIAWLIFSFKMRTVNLEIQNESFRKNSYYQDQLALMSDSKNLAELDTKYASIIKSHPEAVKHFSKPYKTLKRKLKEPLT